MRSTAVAMLFAPPRPPLRLDMGSGYVLGRSPSCDLPVPSLQASRRHAHVSWMGQGFVVADLGSTNGTFVNGERVQGKRLLRPGDRILVGDRAVVFCQVDPALAPEAEVSGDSDTIAFSHPPLAPVEDALHGSLREIPAFAVLQVLEMGLKTGLLAIFRGEDEQRIWFRDGVPVHAEADGFRGIDAALAIVQAADGRFAFQPGAATPARSLAISVAELLLEASRRRDESEDAAARSPAASTVVPADSAPGA